MQPVPATSGPLPTGPEWLYEVKWGGVRVLVEVDSGVLGVRGPGGRDLTPHFPELAGVARLAPDVLLDGEVVVVERGVPGSGALADRMRRAPGGPGARRRPATFVAFDVLRLYGVDLRARPLHERRATLERLDTAALGAVVLSPVYTDGAALLHATGGRGMAGVVAKRRDGVHRPGERDAGWVEVTHRRTQCCLVAGWRPGAGTTGIGALLLGVLDRRGFSFAGRVGSGPAGDRVQQVLAERLAALAAPSPPFRDRVPRPDARGARWCEPAVLVEVDHLGWTGAGRLRHPVLAGIRDDLEPADAVRVT